MKPVVLLIFSLLILPIASAGVFEIKTSTDKVEIEESLGNVIQALSEREIPELKSAEVNTRVGKTKVNQYIRFSGVTPPRVSYQKNEQNEVQDFLYVATTNNVNNALLEYELEFASGLKSDIKNAVLEDIIDKKIYLFNDEYVIVQGKKDGAKVEITLLGGGITDIVDEGTSKTFTLGGTAYTVQVTSVEDSTKAVRLRVNGQDLTPLTKGESVTINNAVVGVSKIIFSTSASTPDVVEVFVGQKAITFLDTTGDNTFSQDVSVNKRKIENGYVKIDASESNSVLTITSIKYRITPISDVYIKQNEKLSQYIQNSDVLLGNWDLAYGGLSTTIYNEVKLIPTNNNEYTLTFKNKGGQTLTVPFITNRGGTFKLGDDDQDLIIQEGSAGNFNIDRNDYFVLTNKNDKTGDTYILKYESIQTNSNTITFYDVASGQARNTPYSGNTSENLTGSATLVVGSGSGAITANIIISNSSNNPIAVDLNGNGQTDGSTVVDIVTADGGILDMSTLSGSTYAFNVKTERSQLEEGIADESISVTVEARSGNLIGVRDSFGSLTTFSIPNHRKAMSNYGVKFDLLAPGANEAETLTILYPQQQAFAKVYVEVGEGTLGAATVSQQQQADRCGNGVLDGDETGIDCGGSCQPCAAACSDRVQNQGEAGIDCGGPCPPCATVNVTGPDCDGCMHTDAEGKNVCLDAGAIVGSLYCGLSHRLEAQKDNGESCEAAYECKIGICEDGLCGKRITPVLLIINIGVVIVVLAVLYFIITLLKRLP